MTDLQASPDAPEVEVLPHCQFCEAGRMTRFHGPKATYLHWYCRSCKRHLYGKARPREIRWYTREQWTRFMEAR